MTQATPAVTPADVRTWHDNHYRRTSPEDRAGWWEAFEDVPDPYNEGNRMSGWVQRAGGDDYGTLMVSQVNGRPAPQRIIATPKASYPYRRDRAWLLERALLHQRPPEVRRHQHLPVLLPRPSRQPVHLLQAPDPALRAAPVPTPPGQNPGPLPRRGQPHAGAGRGDDLRALRAEQPDAHRVREWTSSSGASAAVTPQPATSSRPTRAKPSFARLDCPLAEPGQTSMWQDIHREYVRRQSRYSEALVPIERDGEKVFQGHEGEMLYVRFPDGDRSEPGPFTRMVKLKPPEIEEIHQASNFVPRTELEATVRNIFEAADNPDITDFVMLLAEEWSDDQIGRSMDTAERVLAEALAKRAFQDSVLEVFFEHFQAEDFYSDTRTVMRLLSEHYPKADMQRVYGCLAVRLPYADRAETRT